MVAALAHIPRDIETNRRARLYLVPPAPPSSPRNPPTRPTSPARPTAADLLAPPAPTRRRPTAADYRRRRVLVLGLGVLSLLFVAIAVRSALDRIGGGPLATTGATSPAGVAPIAAHSWAVRPGDTLWTIATAVHPQGDVRPLVDVLARETGGRPLQPGQVIPLP